MIARYYQHDLKFKFPAGTSRGILHEKSSTFIILEQNGSVGIGECSTIPGLSIDSGEKLNIKIAQICYQINQDNVPDLSELQNFPAIAFGLETALLSLKSTNTGILFPSDFTNSFKGISINGLVWMGNKEFMLQQIQEKIENGYRCIKLKVGALDFDTEVDILSQIRKKFSATDIEIRLDANGGFTSNDALQKLEILSKFNIHSIEQPIKQGQIVEMARICKNSPIPIVLDEELIAVPNSQMKRLLEVIKPSYIILKPSLIGGFKQSEAWIDIANELQIKWWITSALESNIGLNAIAQWTYTLRSELPQGLGTGQLYYNNIPSPLEISNAKLYYNNRLNWDLSNLNC